MELRKIQKTRGGTFFVTLPKSWALKNCITQGSFVSTSMVTNGRLVIDPKYMLEPVPQIATILLGPFLSREIIGKYLLGYDIIRVEAKNSIKMAEREIIKETSSRLIGLEIIEEDYSKIVMQCLLEPSALPPKKILRREHLIASAMYRDSIHALVEGDTQLARGVSARDNEVNRLYFLLVRILRTVIQKPSLSEKLGIKPIECLDYRMTASLVESIGDLSSKISDYTSSKEDTKIKGKVAKSLTSLHKVVYECYKDAVTAFFTRNIEIADSVKERRGIITEKINKIKSIYNDLPFEMTQNLISVTSLIGRIYDYSVDISDLTTQKTQ